jgi:hypothetical protein
MQKDIAYLVWAMISFPGAIYLATGNGWAVVASINLLVFIASAKESF